MELGLENVIGITEFRCILKLSIVLKVDQVILVPLSANKCLGAYLKCRKYKNISMSPLVKLK